MDREWRGILTGLHISGLTLFGIAVVMFLLAAAGLVSPSRSTPRTAVGTAAGTLRSPGPYSVLAPTTTSSSTTATVAPPAASPPPANPPSQCHTADLAIVDNGGQDSGGTLFGTMVVRNQTKAPCTVYGYAGLMRRDASGRPLPTTVLRDRHPAVQLVSIGPQQQASFGYSTVDRPSRQLTVCGRAASVDVIPPDETTPVKVASSLIACGPAGIVNVGPFEPGAAASIAGT